MTTPPRNVETLTDLRGLSRVQKMRAAFIANSRPKRRPAPPPPPPKAAVRANQNLLLEKIKFYLQKIAYLELKSAAEKRTY